MDDVSKTLYIPLYGKAKASKQNVIIKDPMAERIWEKEKFPIRGASKSKWLIYNMAMRARIFDDWVERMLERDRDAVVLHLGCGLDSRCLRVAGPYTDWIDGDLPDVISVRRKYYEETPCYHMIALDAADPAQIGQLPDAGTAIVVLEGLSMYLSNEQVNGLLRALEEKYAGLHILMDVYTEFGVKASKYKNPVNDVGVTALYGRDDMQAVLSQTGIRSKAEHPLTPDDLVNELRAFDRTVFKILFNRRVYRKIYRLYELERRS